MTPAAAGETTTPKNLSAVNFVKCRAKCLSSSQIQKSSEAPRASAAAAGATREIDGKAKNRRLVAARKVVIYRTISIGLGPDASNASVVVPAVQSDLKSKRDAPNQRQRRGGDKTKSIIVATEPPRKIENSRKQPVGLYASGVRG